MNTKQLATMLTIALLTGLGGSGIAYLAKAPTWGLVVGEIIGLVAGTGAYLAYSCSTTGQPESICSIF